MPFTFHPFLQVLGVRVVHPSKQSYLRLGLMEVAHDSGMKVAIKNRILWVFPKIGGPQNGRFIMENPIKIHDLGVPLFLEAPLSRFWFQRFILNVHTYLPKWFNLTILSQLGKFHLFYCPRLHERPMRRDMEEAGFWHHSVFFKDFYILYFHTYTIYIYIIYLYIYIIYIFVYIYIYGCFQK